MVTAYVLIQTENGASAEVAAKIRQIEGVDRADHVTGPYDVIVQASAEDLDALGGIVISRIQDVPGLTRTLTCTVVHL